MYNREDSHLSHIFMYVSKIELSPVREFSSIHDKLTVSKRPFSELLSVDTLESGPFLPTLRGRTQYAESASVGLNSSAGFSSRRICENIYWWSLVINSSICRDNVKPDFFNSMDMVTSPERVYTGKCGILAKRQTKHPQSQQVFYSVRNI